MSEFNLIPQSYRLRLARLRAMRLAAAGAGGLLVLCIAAWFALGRWIDTVRAEVFELEQRQAVSTRQRDTIANLNRQKQTLDQQWQLLESLRSGLPAKAMMENVQAALRADELWFVKWRLRRAGVVTERQPVANQPGYFIIVKRQGNAEDWKTMTHMTISGQAWNHSTLSEFAQRLLQQPDVEDVRVQRTSQSFGRDRKPLAVDFDLAIVFKADDRKS